VALQRPVGYAAAAAAAAAWSGVSIGTLQTKAASDSRITASTGWWVWWVAMTTSSYLHAADTSQLKRQFIRNIAEDTVMNVSLTLYIIRWICIVSYSFRRSLYDAISSTLLSQLSADRPPSCCLLASRFADQIWTSPLSVRPATFACGL